MGVSIHHCLGNRMPSARAQQVVLIRRRVRLNSQNAALIDEELVDIGHGQVGDGGTILGSAAAAGHARGTVRIQHEVNGTVVGEYAADDLCFD